MSQDRAQVKIQYDRVNLTAPMSQGRAQVNIQYDMVNITAPVSQYCAQVNIIIDGFYIALFSAREQTHCARM